MANDESILREVDQSLAEDDQAQFFQKNVPLLIGGAAAIVALVAGMQFWSAQKNSAAEKSAIGFEEAVRTLEEDPEAGRAALASFKDEASAGYGVLSDMRRAASLAGGGERLAALEIYRAIYGNGAAPKRMKHLARLRAASLALEDGRDAVLSDLGDLQNDSSVIGFYAREIAGVAALNVGDYETAKAIFERAAESTDAPQAVRIRAEELAALAASGKAGVNITKDLQANDLSKSLERTSPSLDAIEGFIGDGHSADDGHDHGVTNQDAPVLEVAEPPASDARMEENVEGEEATAEPEPEETAGANDNPEPQE